MELFWACIRPLVILGPLNSFCLKLWNNFLHIVSIPDVAQIDPEHLRFPSVP